MRLRNGPAQPSWTWRDRHWSGAEVDRLLAAFYAYVSSRKRHDETMADALLRLVGGPHPDAVAGALSDDAAEGMCEAVERRGERAERGRASVARSFSTSGDR